MSDLVCPHCKCVMFKMFIESSGDSDDFIGGWGCGCFKSEFDSTCSVYGGKIYIDYV